MPRIAFILRGDTGGSQFSDEWVLSSSHGEPTFKCGAWQLSVLPIGLALFGQRYSGWKERRLVSPHFEDLSAVVQGSRVSPGFVSGLCSD